MLAPFGVQVYCIYGGTRYEPQVHVYTCTIYMSYAKFGFGPSKGFVQQSKDRACRMLSKVRKVAKYYLSHARNTPTIYMHAVTYIRYKTD